MLGTTAVQPTVSPTYESQPRKVQLDFNQAHALFLEQNELAKGTYRSAACNWVKNNEALWRKWVPASSLCLRGQGLFDLVNKSFVAERTESWLVKGNEQGASYSD